MFTFTTLCAAQALHILILFSTQEFLAILKTILSENSCLKIFSYVVHRGKHRQPTKFPLINF